MVLLRVMDSLMPGRDRKAISRSPGPACSLQETTDIRTGACLPTFRLRGAYGGRAALPYLNLKSDPHGVRSLITSVTSSVS